MTSSPSRNNRIFGFCIVVRAVQKPPSNSVTEVAFVTINNPPQTAVPLETPVVIDSLRLSKIENRKVVVFVDDTTQLYLPIWVGPNEGDAILSELQNVPHHTSSALIEQLNPQGKPVKITISELVDEVYKATITLEKDGQETIMAMRPSDAILVAIRLKLPMMVSNTVMQGAARTKPSNNIIVRAIAFAETILQKLKG